MGTMIDLRTSTKECPTSKSFLRLTSVLLAAALAFVLVGASLLMPNALGRAYADESGSNAQASTSDIRISSDGAVPTLAGTSIDQASMGAEHRAAVTEDGDLYVWGGNDYGQVGNDTTTECANPVKVLSGVKQVSLGRWHSAAITDDGDLYVWGLNNYGQVGDGTKVDRATPVKVLSDVKQVSLGGYHSAAITEDGDLYVWGSNSSGQVGNGTTAECTSPVKVLSGVKEVSLGSFHSAAIMEDGDLYVWGLNRYGELGNGRTPGIGGDWVTSPVKILSGANQVSLGLYCSAAITENGDLYTWGSNSFWQLANGTTERSTSPLKVLSGVKQVSLGGQRSAAIMENGDLYMWGSNNDGALGDGTTTSRLDPVKILSGVKQVSLGLNYSSAVTEDGELYLWADIDLGAFESVRPVVTYSTGVEGSTSWQGWVSDGELSGTVGKSLRMEGLQIKLENAPYSGGIRYRSQLQSDGWEKTWAEDGDTSGYAPKVSGGKRLEAVQIELYGEMAEHYDVWYHLQVQRFGWMGWVKNGEVSGTVGYAFRVEALEIVLTPKGTATPTVGNKVVTPESNMLSFVRCRSYDNKVWQGAKGEGDVSGTRKQSKTQVRVGLASSSLSAAGIDRGNSYVQVRVFQDGKWSAWSKEDDAYVGNAKGGTIRGIQARIAPGTTLESQFDLYYRAEVKDGTGNACWLGWAVNGETAGQKNINLEQLSFSLVPKGEPAPPANADELQGTIAHIKQTWVIERWPCNWPKPNYRFEK